MGLLNYYKEKSMKVFVKSNILQHCEYCGKTGTKFYKCRFEDGYVIYLCSYNCLKKEKEIYFLFKKIDNLKFEKFEQQLNNRNK